MSDSGKGGAPDDRFLNGKTFPRVMKKIVKALAKYRWAMIGGRSVEVWANPPQTPDIDCLVRFHARDIDKVMLSMKKAGFVLLRRFIQRDFAPMFFFKDMEENTEVDLIGSFEDVHEWAIDRSVFVKRGGVKFRVAQAEDVVILKANAAVTPGRGKEKMEHDIAAIKAIQEKMKLDEDYIEIVLSQANADWSDEANLLVGLGVLKR